MAAVFLSIFYQVQDPNPPVVKLSPIWSVVRRHIQACADNYNQVDHQNDPSPSGLKFHSPPSFGLQLRLPGSGSTPPLQKGPSFISITGLQGAFLEKPVEQ